MAKKKLDSLMKESKIRDREDPDSFTIAALPPAGKDGEKSSSKVEILQLFPAGLRMKNDLRVPARLQGKSEDGTDTADEANPSSNKRTGRSFMGTFSKRKVRVLSLLLHCPISRLSVRESQWPPVVPSAEKDQQDEEDVQLGGHGHGPGEQQQRLSSSCAPQQVTHSLPTRL